MAAMSLRGEGGPRLKNKRFRLVKAKAIDLPEDILIDILSRLPLKYVVRFRSVCKSWRHLFRNQSFIDKHHHFQTLTSKTKNTTFILRHTDEVRGDYCFSILSDANRNGDEIMTVVRTMFAPFLEGFKSPRIIGSANGLLCLYYYHDDHAPYFYYYWDDDEYARDLFVVWNPATGEFKRVPFPPIKPLRGAKKTRTSNVGFGFDKNTNDYKIIRFVRNLFHNDRVYCKDQVQLYSLNNDSWEEISFLDDVITEPNPTWCFTPYRNGVYYWWATSVLDDYREVPLILSFDFANQVFETLFLGDDYDFCERVKSKSYYGLAVCDGLLSFVNYTNDNPYTNLFKDCFSTVDIWVMNEHGVNKPWEKACDHVIVGHGVFVPIGIWKHYLFLNSDTGLLLLCDIYTNKSRILELRTNNAQVANYVESLVPIPDTKNF